MQSHLPQLTLENVVDRIFTSRRITRDDQQMFMSALLSKHSLSREEQIQVDRVFEGLRKGLIRVTS
jgi:hypothetical protein